MAGKYRDGTRHGTNNYAQELYYYAIETREEACLFNGGMTIDCLEYARQLLGRRVGQKETDVV